jgi:3',5'-cyclic AMP phosphodiesterase CpdA
MDGSSTRALAHISDLHVGRDARTDAAAAQVCQALLAADVGQVLVTGDVTHRGLGAELASFEQMFAPLRDRMIVVPGNHDRMGDDVARSLQRARVEVERRPGLFVIRLDSTAPHNRSPIDSHGELSDDDVAAVDSAVDLAPSGTLVVLMLHHHLLPLPPEGLPERISKLLGWPNAAELPRGRELLGRVQGRCDVVVHGHRHQAGEVRLVSRNGRELRVMNAGSTPQLGRARILLHRDGQVLAEYWCGCAPALAGVARGRASRDEGSFPAAA